MAYKYTYDSEEKQYQPPKLKTDRKMWKYMLFSILTLGIYSIVFFIPFSFDLDKIAPKKDHSKTMNYLFAYVFALFTFSIVLLIWHYDIAKRVQEALERRDISYEFNTNTFWGWYIVGSLFLVGQFVYFYKLFKAMNLLCEDYNNNPVIENAR